MPARAWRRLAASRSGSSLEDEQVFREIIEWVVGNGAKGASFDAAQITRSTAYLRGSIVGDRRLVTDSGLAEYLADALARTEGIHLNITAHFAPSGSELPAGEAAAAA